MAHINDKFLAGMVTYEDIAEHRKKYLDSKGIKFNPEKFIRKGEAQRALGIVYYSMNPNDRTPEIEKFYEDAKRELGDVETLAMEIDRRIREDDEHTGEVNL